jgi:uncharacterized protein (DUF488 family)
LTIFTIGHSTRSADDFVALLHRSGVHRVYDIRAFPGSRRYPQFNSDTLAERLRLEGIAYEHHPELGGRRRPSPDAPPTAWRNEAFRGYAQYMRTDAFRRAIDHLIAVGAEANTAIMCSEAVPWRCHRNLVSDALVARGVDVQHILDSKTSPHALTSFAVIEHDDVLYPAPGELSQQELDINVGDT